MKLSQLGVSVAQLSGSSEVPLIGGSSHTGTGDGRLSFGDQSSESPEVASGSFGPGESSGLSGIWDFWFFSVFGEGESGFFHFSCDEVASHSANPSHNETLDVSVGHV